MNFISRKDKIKKKICIAGKNLIAIKGLQIALQKYKKFGPILVIPIESDNGEDFWQPSFKKFAKKFGDDVKLATLDEVENTDELIFISLEFDKLLKTEKFRSDDLFNMHFSKLPKYKGMYTSCHPILNGETESGCTIHKIENGIDTGDVVSQITFEISTVDTAKTLYEKYIKNGSILLEQTLPSLVEGNYQCKQQSAFGSTYFSKSSINYSNLVIDLNTTAFQIMRQINAFNHRSYQIPKVFGKKVSYVDITEKKSTLKPGSIIKTTDRYFEISTVDFNCKIFFDRFDELLLCVEKNYTLGIVEIIKDNPSLISESNSKGWTPLIVAAYGGHSDSVKCLIALGADVNQSNHKGTTPLMYAKDFFVKYNNEEIIRIFLENGSDYNFKDINGLSVFDYLEGDYKRRFSQLIREIEDIKLK